MTWPVSAGASHDEKVRFKTETLRFQATKKPIQSGPTPSVFCFRVHGSQPLVSVLSLCTVLGSSYNTFLQPSSRRFRTHGIIRTIALPWPPLLAASDEPKPVPGPSRLS